MITFVVISFVPGDSPELQAEKAKDKCTDLFFNSTGAPDFSNIAGIATEQSVLANEGFHLQLKAELPDRDWFRHTSRDDTERGRPNTG